MTAALPATYTMFDSPIGGLLATTDGTALTSLYTPGHRHPVNTAWIRDDRHPVLRQVHAQLAEYFAGTRREFDVPLSARGTAFQEAVWKGLCDIGFGETESYGRLAARLGAPTAMRAVGAANGRNPISIVVPCHRVIGANGSMTGYAGGVAAKQWLLQHEFRVLAAAS